MLEIKNEENVVLIGKLLALHKQSQSAPIKNKINLYLSTRSEKPEFVWDYLVIDYPGEYDQEGVYFKVIDRGNLNYLIKYQGEFISILQDEEALEDVEEVDNMDWRILSNQKLVKKLEELDTGWEIIKI